MAHDNSGLVAIEGTNDKRSEVDGMDKRPNPTEPFRYSATEVPTDARIVPEGIGIVQMHQPLDKITVSSGSIATDTASADETNNKLMQQAPLSDGNALGGRESTELETSSSSGLFLSFSTVLEDILSINPGRSPSFRIPDPTDHDFLGMDVHSTTPTAAGIGAPS